jgi:hypothetical protein
MKDMKDMKDIVMLKSAEHPYAVYAGDEFVARTSNLRAAAALTIDRAFGNKDLWRVVHIHGDSWQFKNLILILNERST